MPIKYPSHIDKADHIAVLDKLADASNQGLLSNCYAHLDYALNTAPSKELYDLSKDFLDLILDPALDPKDLADKRYEFLDQYASLQDAIINQPTEDIPNIDSPVRKVSTIQSHVLNKLKRVLETPESKLVTENKALQICHDQMQDIVNFIDSMKQQIKSIAVFNSLSEEDLDTLSHLPVTSTDFDTLLNHFLTLHSINPSLTEATQLRNILIDMDQAANKFIEITESLGDLFENGQNEVNKLRAEKRQTQDLEHEIGLSLDIGTHFTFDDPDTGHRKSCTLVNKQAIYMQDNLDLLQDELRHQHNLALQMLAGEPDPRQTLEDLIDSENPIDDADLENHIEEIRELRNQILMQQDLSTDPNVYTTFELEFTFELEDGSTIILNRKELESEFKNLNFLEAIDSKKKLEDSISFTIYGQTIHARSEDGPGTILTQRFGATEPTYKDFEVIDITDDQITLDQPIQVPGPESSEMIEKSTMSLAEFARWFKLHIVEQKMDSSDARQVLAKQPEILKNKYPDTSPEEHIFSDQPIRIEKGEQLIARDGSTYTITDITEDENGNELISLDDGRTMPVSDFVKFCKDYELESLPDQILAPDGTLIDNPAKKKSKSVKEEIEKNGGKFWQYLPRINIFQDPLDLLGLEFMTYNDYAAIGSMLTETVTKHLERAEKERLNRIGCNLPGEAGKKFSDSQDSINKEKIQNEKDRIAPNTIAEVTEMLAKAPDRYKARAHMDFLADSGSLDLTSTALHNRLNKLLKKHAQEIRDNIPKGHKLRDYQIKNGFNAFGKQGKPAAIDALNALYGSGNGESISKNNDSNYESECSSWGNLIREESQKEGFKATQEMHDLLYECHKGKQNINPAQYQGYLDFVMMSPHLDEVEDAIFYIIAGMATKNKNGQYLLTESYLSKLKRNDLPALDYLVRFTRTRFGRKVKLSSVASELLSEFSPNFKKGLDGNNRYDIDKMRQFLFCDVLSHEKTYARVQNAFDANTHWDKDHTPYTFPAADPGVMKNILKIDAQYGDNCRMGNAQIHNCFQGFYQSIKAIRQANLDPSALKSFGDLSEYHSKKDPAKAEHLSKVLGSWYFLYAHGNQNILKAYGDKASSIAGSFSSISNKKKKPLDEVAQMIRPIISHYFSDNDNDLTPYIMGDKPIPDELKNLVLDFPFLLMQKVAADKDNAILSILTGKSAPAAKPQKKKKAPMQIPEPSPKESDSNQIKRRRAA